MQLVSLCTGLPRLVMRGEEPVSTGIYKAPVAGKVMLRTLNLDGDRQADLSVHGGPYKAAYLYPSEHYQYWKDQLPEVELPWGSFGENFTTTGLKETATHIGDTFRVGNATVMVTQPRLPCFKLGIKFGRNDIIRRFLQSERTGFYFSVVVEGEVAAGDLIEALEQNERGVTVVEVTRLYASDRLNTDLLRRAIETEALPESWRSHFKRQLDELTNKT
jgi:MOSC domain-containing protein YiiM